MIKVLKADTKILQEKAFAIRAEVFVVEQQVSREDEFDEYETISQHFVALDESENPVGAARWRVAEKGIKLERFAVKATHRGQGVGSMLVKSVLKDIAEKKGKGHFLYLHAQLTAVDLYKKFGFQTKGEQFSECDIMHYMMFLQS